MKKKHRHGRTIQTVALVNPLALIRNWPAEPERTARIKAQAEERRQRRARKRLGKAFVLDLRKAETDGEV